MRFANYNGQAPANEAPELAGDSRWVGVNGRLSPRILSPGWLSEAANVRMRNGHPTTRGGCVRPAWAHRLNEYGNPRAWDGFKAAINFRDPDNVASVIVVADQAIWRVTVNNVPMQVPLPAHCGLPEKVSLTQAFGKLFLFRGHYLRPLVCDDLEVGFADVVDLWAVADTYAAGDLVAWGPWTTLSAAALTSSGLTATLVFPAAHGLVTGADLTIKGAVETTYNGRFLVTVVNETTVTYGLPATPSATPATGTVKVSDMTDFWELDTGWTIGDEPGVDACWVRNYTILPNGIEAAYLNNRLFVPTAYLPGDTTALPGENGNKADYLAATDVLDYRQFFLDTEFRINQGSADELLCVVKGNAQSLVAFKSDSVYLLQNIYGDLSALRLEQLKDVYGIVNGRAVTTVGRDLVFVSPRRGVVSLVQSETGELQGADITMSDPIQPDIDRIAWQFGDRIRLTWWDNKLYVAVPLDSGEALGANRVPRDVFNMDVNDSSRWYLYLDAVNQPYVLKQGQTYRWEPGSLASEEFVWQGIVYTAAVDFTWGGEPIWLRWTAGASLTSTSSIFPVYTGVNNAVLVYDYQLSAWQGIDSGKGVCPSEFVVAKVHGRDRLLACMADGTICIYEASQDGDVQLDGIATPIESSVLTRGYGADVGPGWWRSRRVNLQLATWAAEWSLEAVNEGVNEVATLKTGVTRDRTKFRKPVCSAPFDPLAEGADFDRAHREDYSEVGNDLYGWEVPAAGFLADRRQVFTEQVRIPSASGEVVQIRLSNSGGSLSLMAVALDLTQTARREGSKT